MNVVKEFFSTYGWVVGFAVGFIVFCVVAIIFINSSNKPMVTIVPTTKRKR
jgi:cytosine/uracil/thiamine/allantoin permease